jgi:hypothetical protein
MTETLFDRNMVFAPAAASPLLLGYISVNHLSVRTLDVLRGKSVEVP